MPIEPIKVYQNWTKIKAKSSPHAKPDKPDAAVKIHYCDPDLHKDFHAFLAEVGEPPGPDVSVQMIDDALGYVKGNLAWKPRLYGSRMMTLSPFGDRKLTVDGQEKTLREWAKITRVSLHTMASRERHGVKGEDLIENRDRRSKKRSPLVREP